jgi:MFS family permease
MDLTPLRDSRDFRILFGAGGVTYFGAMMTFVAVPYQLYRLTGSNLAVGLMGLVELVPLVVFGLYGGALADHYDRRRLLVLAGVAQAVFTAALLVNAALASPQIWALYLVGGLLSAASAVARPSREALVPRVVRHDQLTPAVALNSLAMQIGLLAGPAVGGLLVAGPGPVVCYAVDVTGIALATALYSRLRAHPPSEASTPPSVAGIVEGLRYAAGRRDLLGTYLIDIVAMFTAMPETLFPSLATTVFHRPDLLGLMYTAGTAGSVVATATSGWTRRVHHHGRAIVLAAIVWGAAIAAAGLAPNVWLLLLGLAVAGGADMISGIFRGTVWNQTIPDELRGRLAGVEMLSYSVGPLGGQVRAGLVADAAGVRASIVSGGLACVGLVALTAGALPSFWRYDARTDEHAVRERDLRRARDESPQPSR